MKARRLQAAMSILAAMASLAAGCDSLPGRPRESDRPLRPSQVTDFAVLYRDACAGCHGMDGRFGAALPLAHPVYLALVDDEALRRVIANGVPRTSMPPFARRAGGTLTDARIDVLIAGMRQRWAQPDAIGKARPPAYAAESPGDAARGAAVYEAHCASCHGHDGTGGPKTGSIVDRAYLALASGQALRTLVIAGRPDLGHPDWRGDGRRAPMTADEVSDVVAWLLAKRAEPAAAGDVIARGQARY
jgi:cytochrome c oxidase cbb3-type subunit 3